ncbi:Putative flippase GtrA (transmembrane translocase of bactoprenol-linked glucose) [Algoriphagus ornithinivorans]|uniref:Putative flippase GtrA (Transmembrane translocase of bactoprenol-linked glucose) n=1 Tax=Algoriphagus ornithinivorans TaxID=226506 RepID=A0A1I5AVU0_9BACT|nr:GtrA family protein [Algoriphagus ornithinivorans]SFN66567.1 Putative flippase GtrA (transmembrane translocase of bactoprenol-linked glucose) [Algoriphagus ornithinivorans]
MKLSLSRGIEGFLQFFYPIFKKWLAYDVYAYLAVGAINTALNIFLFAVLYEFILPKSGLDIGSYNIASYTLALIISFFATIPTGFWLSKNFAFKSVDVGKKKTGKQLFKYVLVVSQGLGSDYLILKGLIVFFSMEPTVAKIISTVIVLTVNFLLQKYFTFKKS